MGVLETLPSYWAVFGIVQQFFSVASLVETVTENYLTQLISVDLLYCGVDVVRFDVFVSVVFTDNVSASVNPFNRALFGISHSPCVSYGG